MSQIKIINIIVVLIVGSMMFMGCEEKKLEDIKAAGVVDGDVITIKSLVAGKIETLNIDEGESVEKDDLLTEINSDKLRVQIEAIDIQEKEIPINRKQINRKIKLMGSNLSYWKDQVERFERLMQKESISGDELEKAKLKYQEVEAGLYDAEQSLNALSVRSEKLHNQKQQLQLLIEDHVIISPVTGIVLDRFVLLGELIFPGTAISDILDLDSLYIETFLEESEIGRLGLGQKVKILIDGLENQSFSGVLSSFGRKAEFSPKYIISEKERRSLLYRVKISISDHMEVYKLGMPVTILIEKEI